MNYDWCTLGEVGAVPTQNIWHMVAPGSVKTVCGESVANPDEEWRWADQLSDHRPCDNCTEIEARKADVEAIFASDREPVAKADGSQTTGA